MRKKHSKKIAIVGSGIVGQATGKGFASFGYEVVFYDTNPHIVKDLRKKGFKSWLMDDIDRKVFNEIDFFMISVPTPTINNRVVLSYLESALKVLGWFLRETPKKPVFVVRSTVPPGTTEGLAASILESFSGKIVGKDFGLCMNPEFLREVSAENDFKKPWMIVVGSNNKESGLSLAEIYTKFKSPIMFMSLKEAEMMKYVHNLLNATKISFFNEMRIVSDEIGVDPEVIFPVVVKSAEAIWNPKYGIKNLGAYAGVCLPKDTKAFYTWTLESFGFAMPVLMGTMQTNELVKKMSEENAYKTNKVDLKTQKMVSLFKNKETEKSFLKNGKIKSNFKQKTLSGLPL